MIYLRQVPITFCIHLECALASQAGAKHVYAVDRSDMADTARHIVEVRRSRSAHDLFGEMALGKRFGVGGGGGVHSSLVRGGGEVLSGLVRGGGQRLLRYRS